METLTKRSFHKLLSWLMKWQTKKGSFFIITKSDISNKYERLYPDLFSKRKISIFRKETQTLLLALLELDGAIVVDNSGIIIDYGVKVKKTKILLGHGTRHSAARGISSVPNVCQ